MGDQGSSYSVLQDIPVMVSPHYKLPKQIIIDSELATIPEEALTLGQYSFAVERQAISNVVTIREKQQLAEKTLADRLESYQAEKLKQKKAAARKIAPGFLDTETRILHPQPFHNSKTLLTEEQQEGTSFATENSKSNVSVGLTREESSSPVTSPQNQHYQQQHQQQQQQEQQQQQDQYHPPTSSSSPYQRYRSSSNPADAIPSPVLHQQEKRTSAQSHFDYHKFEQGLAPLDPWDTPENDLMALRSILGNQSTKGGDQQQQQDVNHFYPRQPQPPTSMPAPQYASPYQQHHLPSNNMYPVEGPWVRPPQYPPPPQQQQQQQQQQHPSIHTPPPSSTPGTPGPYFVPALPPKLFKDEHANEMTNGIPQSPPPPPPIPATTVAVTSCPSSSSSPALGPAPPPLPPQIPSQQQQASLSSDYNTFSNNNNGNISHRGSPTKQAPPPLPPFPHNNNNSNNDNNNGPEYALVQELANMGFSHSQATDALQKNENDLARATNFLLDNS
ncbi:hypothetical protein BCR42DRAFT_353611 [Absidia repens]|uniref:UBA domain-containing protein n=1 Tax=Absidia repens TaxID=90262 RepID=A0A1X2IF57_9FUNG|nr:hypothetical protein BCR42DRAFT_353611 [Absidia repens]